MLRQSAIPSAVASQETHSSPQIWVRTRTTWVDPEEPEVGSVNHIVGSRVVILHALGLNVTQVQITSLPPGTNTSVCPAQFLWLATKGS